MAVANTLAYYNTATIMNVKSFIVQGLGFLEVNSCHKRPSLLQYASNLGCKSFIVQPHTALEVNGCGKCSSILKYGNNYDCKKVYSPAS